MRIALLALIAVAIALGLGGWTADYALDLSGEHGSVTVGAWHANPTAGAPDANPYAKARLARLGNLTLGIGEGVQFTAERDTAGRPLMRQCEYRIAGHAPPARVWTLAPYTPEGRLVHARNGLSGWVASNNLMRADDNSFSIAVGPVARAGNWISTTGTGPLTLAFSLYDTPVSSTSGAGDVALPAIERETCYDG